MNLYPFKFEPILKERIWGGTRLASCFGKDLMGMESVGESWEISVNKEGVSVIKNGSFAGKNLRELIETYKEKILGEHVYEKFGKHFPLLIKFLDANADLSIQVHPDDVMAAKKQEPNGKTEMWIALNEKVGPRVISGFKQHTSRNEFVKKLDAKTLTSLFNYEAVMKGDVFFVPAGRIHALCSGNLVLEIQQNSDSTYRIYDYDRKDKNGNERELHLEDALEVTDFSKVQHPKVNYKRVINKAVELVKCDYFTTNMLEITQGFDRDISQLDSFIILTCIEGKCLIGSDNDMHTEIKAGETILVPAAMGSVSYEPLEGEAKLIEVYLEK